MASAYDSLMNTSPSDMGSNSAYSSAGGFGDVLENWFSPGTAANKFNATQAQIDRIYNAGQAQLNRDFNASEAQKQRDYEERLSNTAYQRAAQDMRAAGLNPYAVYGGASAAAVPSGSAASYSGGGSSGARSGKSGSGVTGIIGSAFQLVGKLIGMK